jgi:hypothetical protein
MVGTGSIAWRGLGDAPRCSTEKASDKDLAEPHAKTGMDADRGVDVWTGPRQDRGGRASRSEASAVDPCRVDGEAVHDLARQAGQDGRLAPAASLVAVLEPVPVLVTLADLGWSG